MCRFSLIVSVGFWLTAISGVAQEVGSAAVIAGESKPTENGVRGFVGVEPFEVRLEALVEVAPYREKWRIEGDQVGRAQRDPILENLVTLFLSGVNLTSPDASIEFTDRLVRFVRRDEEKGFVEDDRDSIPLSEALVGITLSSSVSVRDLEIEWLWFAPGQERVVVEIASQGSPAARYVTPEENTVHWTLDEEIVAPELLPIPDLVQTSRRPLKYLFVVGIGLWIWGSVIVIREKQHASARVGWIFFAGLACGLVALNFKTNRFETPDAETMDEIVYHLLRNTYHAFDYRDESAIYDTLEQSVTGPLLERVYLEIRSSLELENSGGPRVRVYEIALRDVEPLPEALGDPTVFQSRAEWVTIGEVTHWGHTHERTNRYEAEFTVAGRGGTWKISGLDLLNEERVQTISRRASQPE